MKPCPCNSTQTYANCCEPYLNGKAIPQTPETLMRSRYTAYSMANITYIKHTMQGKPLVGFNDIEAERWAKSVYWLGLRVVNAHQDQVEFIARYLDKDMIKTIHEVSQFQHINHHWFYVDGTPISAPAQRVSRNMPCPCGSQKKFKNCHAVGHHES
ncbi:MAG: YchJ family protein [Gammaproteobacteria bacterium]|nr:YchJ family protein [Gammaproteobacteria bacterium]